MFLTRFPRAARTRIFASRTRPLFFPTTAALKLTDYLILIDTVLSQHFVQSCGGLPKRCDVGLRARLSRRNVVPDRVAMSGDRDRLVALQQICRQFFTELANADFSGTH